MYHVFAHERGPRRLAEACLNGHDQVPDVLQQAGLSGELESAGFARAAYLEALNLLERGLSFDRHQLTPLERTLDWSLQNATLRYPDLEVSLVHALVNPWRDRRHAARQAGFNCGAKFHLPFLEAVNLIARFVETVGVPLQDLELFLQGIASFRKTLDLIRQCFERLLELRPASGELVDLEGSASL